MITTHVLDIARGCPATGVSVILEMHPDEIFVATDQPFGLIEAIVRR